MRVLITGGAGFIGSHLADSYLSQGYDVSILDNFVAGKSRNLIWFNSFTRINFI